MNFTRNELTGSIAKRKCPKCSTVIVFYEPHACICNNCGTKVYPTKRMEVIENIKKAKLKKEIESK